MKSYLAKIIFQILCGDGSHTPQFDEQLRFIQAPNQISALEKARYFGKKDEDFFLNHAEVPVQWKFIDVSEIYSIDPIMDGAEVYSRIYEEEDIERLVNRVHANAENILKSRLDPVLYI